MCWGISTDNKIYLLGFNEKMNKKYILLLRIVGLGYITIRSNVFSMVKNLLLTLQPTYCHRKWVITATRCITMMHQSQQKNEKFPNCNLSHVLQKNNFFKLYINDIN